MSAMSEEFHHAGQPDGAQPEMRQRQIPVHAVCQVVCQRRKSDFPPTVP